MEPPKPHLVSLSEGETNAGQITAHLPSKEALKSIFGMLVGNPDSILKVFHKAMIVAKDDIDKLDEQICNKLGIHQVEASKTTFDITLSDNTVLEFETWRGASINLAIPQYVTAVSIRWDFMVRLPRYPLPQRHILTVRIGEGAINMARLMQAAFSKDPTEADDFDLARAQLYCRVDFINQILSQELVNAVDSWHKGTREAVGLLPKKCANDWFTTGIDIFLSYTPPLWAALLATLFLFRHYDPARLTQPVILADFRYTIIWLLSSAIGTTILFLIFKRIAMHASTFLARHVPRTRFELTSGDTNRREKDKKKSIVRIAKFAFGFVVTLTCNLLGAYLFAKWFSSPL